VAITAFATACGGGPTPSPLRSAPPANGGSGGSTVTATPAPSPVLPSPTAAAASTPPTLTTTAYPVGADGPIGLAVADGTVWVIAADGGRLVAVDPVAGTSRSFDVGPWGTHVLVPDPDEVLVARFDTGGVGQPLAIVTPSSGVVGGLATGSLAGFDLTSDGRLWGLGTEGQVVVVDAARTQVVGRTAIDVNPNEHLDAVAAGDAFFASSDTTSVRRLEGEDPEVTAEIETGGGIPLSLAGGLVWGARADELWAIDPASNAVTERNALTGLAEILDLAVDGGRAWIAARKPGRIGVVVGLELASGRVVGEVPVALPAGVEIDGDTVWVVNYDGDELLRIDQPPA